ncbi:MAG: GTP 3',8-cyclase MoaA [Pseudomonadota bacterium]
MSQYNPQPTDTFKRGLRDLRISVMDRCNFRCPYCMPEDKYNEKFQFLKSHERLSFEEIVRLASLFVQLGVKKLRLTGGEPLLRRDLPDLIGDLTMISGVEDIALTTNGVLLAQKASALKAAGLNRVTVSLDALDDEVFLKMNGQRGGKHHVLEGIEEALDAGLAPVKVNTVVQRGLNDHLLLDLVDHFRGTGVIVRFIEYMDVGTINHWSKSDTVPSSEILKTIAERWPVRPLEKNYVGEVANRYSFLDGAGEIGFVSSVSEPFCGGCNRARLSSDGKLYTCLFANHGTDLKTPLRAGADDNQLLDTIGKTWIGRTDRYSELRASQRKSQNKVEMYYIGG